MRICVLGAGGLGLLVGGRLAQSGVSVTCVARPQHVDAIRAHGLRIGGLRGESTVREPLVAVSEMEQCSGEFDYLILCAKARDTEVALAQAADLRDRIATALSLQNWPGKDAALQAWLGKDRVIGAATTEAATAVGPGQIRHIGTAPTSSYFGRADGGPARAVERLVSAFDDAGMPARVAEDIAQVEWEKLVQIASVSGWAIVALGEGSVAEGLAVREAAEYYVALAGELLQVYRAMGYQPRDFFAPYAQFRDFAARSFEQNVDAAMLLGREMLASGVVGRPSMHEDVVRGRASEVDYCFAPFLQRAEELGVSVPVAQTTYRIIKTIEARRDAR